MDEVTLLPRELRGLQFPKARFLSADEQTQYDEACKRFGEKARKSLKTPLNGSTLFRFFY